MCPVLQPLIMPKTQRSRFGVVLPLTPSVFATKRDTRALVQPECIGTRYTLNAFIRDDERVGWHVRASEAFVYKKCHDVLKLSSAAAVHGLPLVGGAYVHACLFFRNKTKISHTGNWPVL